MLIGEKKTIRITNQQRKDAVYYNYPLKRKKDIVL